MKEVKCGCRIQDMLNTSTGFVSETPTGKRGKLNTSQAEPDAANSTAVGQIFSISCRRFADEPGKPMFRVLPQQRHVTLVWRGVVDLHLSHTKLF